MRHRLVPIFLAICVVGPAAATAPEPAKVEAPRLFSVVSRVSVDAEGIVQDVEPTTTLSPAINAALEANARKIHFAPPMKQGHAVPGITYVVQEACAALDGGTFRLAIRYRGNGPKSNGFPAPRYPPDALRAGASATVSVTYRVLATGAAELENATLTKGSTRWARDFKQSITEWVGQLHYLPEQLDGQPVATRVSYPVEFRSGPRTTRTYSSLADAKRASERDAARIKAEQQAQRIAASPACATAMAASDDAPRQLALDSAFHPVQVN